MGICLQIRRIKLHAPAITPVFQRRLHIPRRHIKIFRKLPQLPTTVGKGLAKIICGQIVLRRPAVGTIFAASHKFIGAVYLMQCAGGQMSQLVVIDAPQKPGGLNLGKVQKYRIGTLIPYGGRRLGATKKWDHIHAVLSAIPVKIRNLKHRYSFFLDARLSRINRTMSRTASFCSSSNSLKSP